MNKEEKQSVARPPRRHGPGAPGEKPKDLGKTLKKLAISLKGYLPIIIIALILAGAGSVLAIIGPNKLSDLTDEITKGLVVNQENVKLITKDVTSNLNEERIKDISSKLVVMSPSNSGDVVIDNIKVSQTDRIEFTKLMANIDTKDQKSMQQLFDKMPSSVKKVFLPESSIKGVKITTNDKVKFLKLMGSVDKNTNANAIYKQIDKLPKTLRQLVKPKLNMNKIKQIVIFMISIYLLSALFNIIQGVLLATLSNRYAKKLRSTISIKINKLPLKYFDNHLTGDILSRVTNDVDMIGMNLSQSMGTLVGATTLFIGSIIMMFKTNWVMALTAIGSSLFGFMFMGIVLKKSQKYFLQRQVELGKLNGHIEEIYSNHNVVKAYNGNYDASLKFDKLNQNVFECNRKSQFLSGLMPSMMNFIGNFGYVCVCVAGAMLVIDNKISFGVIVAFMVYVRLFTSPLSQLGQTMTSVQSIAAAAERVFEFTEEKEMMDESKLTGKLNPKKVKGNIEFKHVKFGYNDDKIIIKDFNCIVKPGEKVAIVGPTGAGKTTMVNLLMKFYNIKDGDILIDGVSTKNLTRQNIHDLFIMVLQDTWLFDGTIKENVKYNKKNVSDKEITKALETVGIDHFVKSLPGNINYNIKNDDSVSQGQKQLLTIARGMIKDAPFLILDEATSSVDTRTEELVQKAMDKLTKGRTSFIIAHRLSTIKNADLILVMNEGNIIEQGNHNELMKKNGFYADLYNSQFKN